MSKRKKARVTDRERINWLADAQVGEVDSMFEAQFEMSQSGKYIKTAALRRAIDAAIKASRAGGGK